MCGLNNDIIYYQDNFCRLTNSYFCDAWQDFIPLTEGVARFLKKHFDRSTEEGFKWLTIYERL